MPDQRAPNASRSDGLGVIALIVLLVVVLWYFRPWLHGVVYAIYTTPTIIIAVVAGLLPFALYGRYNLTNILNAAGTLFIIVLVVTASLGGVLAGRTLGTSTMNGADTTNHLEETDGNVSRIVTQSVANRYASNTLNFPQYRVTNSDIVRYNQSLYWSYALSPDGLWNQLTKKQHGTVLVDMTEQNADIKTVTGDVAKGMGTAFYNHQRWRTLKQGQYLVDYKDSFMVVNDGKQYIATPYTRPDFHWLPLPHTTPEWGGVTLIDSAGNLKDLSSSEARKNDALAGQRLYPFDLARTKVGSTKYRNGILNTYTSHEDEIEVAPVPGEGNDQPFLVQSETGPSYLVAVEPYGNAQGLREVWTVDARTGTYERFAPNESLFGPRKATDYVRQAARTTDWNRFIPSEPIPTVVGGQLYWEVRVVPDDSSGISYVAFVNARTSDVHEAETTNEIRAFMRGNGPGETTTEPSTSTSPKLIVNRVAENGTVIGTIQIYENESVRIVQANSTEH